LPISICCNTANCRCRLPRYSCLHQCTDHVPGTMPSLS